MIFYISPGVRAKNATAHPAERRTFSFRRRHAGKVRSLNFRCVFLCTVVLRTVPLQVSLTTPGMQTLLICYRVGYSSISLSLRDIRRLLSIFILLGFNSARAILRYFFFWSVGRSHVPLLAIFARAPESRRRFLLPFIWLPRLRNIICQDDIANQFCESFHLRCSNAECLAVSLLAIYMRRMGASQNGQMGERTAFSRIRVRARKKGRPARR